MRSIINLLRKQGIASPRILFTTYTSALTAASEQLLKRLLGEDAGLVEVRTADNVTFSIVAAHDGKPRILESKEVRALLKDGTVAQRYDAVVVDEAQDLDATVLRTLIGLCTAPDRLFVTADANQSIYGSGFRWTDGHADLRFQGRTGVLRKNYRITREIGEAAQAYLQGGALDHEAVDRTYAQSDGPLPVMRTARSTSAELDVLVRFLKVASREARQGLGACAVLVPSEALARQRRTVFVAMTRAMRALLVVSPDAPSPLFGGFDPRLWNVATPALAR